MPLDDRLPVIIGVGQALQRVDTVDDARSPVELMVEASRLAIADAGLAGPPPIEAIRVVSLLSWRYRDPARFVAEGLGCTVAETALSTGGGNSPQLLVTEAAEQIQRGELEVALLTGAECWRTRMRARRAGGEPPWPEVPEGVTPTRQIGSEMVMSHPVERDRGIVMPVQMYPLFESALRAAAGRSVDEHQREIAALWARFSAVAASNPYAWDRTPHSAEEIRTPGPRNRMIGLPYPKLMNSNNDVDQAAAILMCSLGRARALGVPLDRIVFVHAGVDTKDHAFVSDRADLHRSPAVRIGGRTCLELAGLTIDDIALVDLYSCFPAAVQIGRNELGLGNDRDLTLTGGLSFAGGPWNNYVMHAIATMVGAARQQPGARGLVWANGGFVTKHGFGVYSTEPPAAGFRRAVPQAEIDALPRRQLATAEEAAGPATVEAFTVMHDREGRPELAIAVCRLDDGRRAWGTSVDDGVSVALTHGEWVGQHVTLDAAGALRLA